MASLNQLSSSSIAYINRLDHSDSCFDLIGAVDIGMSAIILTIPATRVTNNRRIGYEVKTIELLNVITSRHITVPSTNNNDSSYYIMSYHTIFTVPSTSQCHLLVTQKHTHHVALHQITSQCHLQIAHTHHATSHQIISHHSAVYK